MVLIHNYHRDIIAFYEIDHYSRKQLNGKGLRTRLKVLGKSTNGAVTVLRQRLCEALEVSAAAPPAAAANAACLLLLLLLLLLQ